MWTSETVHGLLLAGNWVVQMSTMNGRLFDISRFWASTTAPTTSAEGLVFWKAPGLDAGQCRPLLFSHFGNATNFQAFAILQSRLELRQLLPSGRKNVDLGDGSYIYISTYVCICMPSFKLMTKIITQNWDPNGNIYCIPPRGGGTWPSRHVRTLGEPFQPCHPCDVLKIRILLIFVGGSEPFQLYLESHDVPYF